MNPSLIFPQYERQRGVCRTGGKQASPPGRSITRLIPFSTVSSSALAARDSAPIPPAIHPWLNARAARSSAEAGPARTTTVAERPACQRAQDKHVTQAPLASMASRAVPAVLQVAVLETATPVRARLGEAEPKLPQQPGVVMGGPVLERPVPVPGPAPTALGLLEPEQPLRNPVATLPEPRQATALPVRWQLVTRATGVRWPARPRLVKLGPPRPAATPQPQPRPVGLLVKQRFLRLLLPPLTHQRVGAGAAEEVAEAEDQGERGNKVAGDGFGNRWPVQHANESDLSRTEPRVRSSASPRFLTVM